MMTATVAASFPGLAVTGTAATYTWQQWVDDVRKVFDQYNAVVTADVNMSFAGAVVEPIASPYSRTSGAAPFPPAVGLPLVWDTSIGGPTGNGVNEIILCDQPIGGIGYASMLVDPADGTIIECDLVFNVGPTAASPTGTNGLIQPIAGPGSATTSPTEWTALHHEIGHFYGLDHTNLHSGAIGPTPASYAPLPAFGTPTLTRARYPTTLTPGQRPFPMMVGFITHLGLGSSVTGTPALPHADDAIGLSLIYPVDMPRPLNAKLPLINTTASIRGRCADAANVNGIFGRNVWAVRKDNLDVTGSGVPYAGVISGTARITNDPLTQAPGLYVDNRVPLSPPSYFPTLSQLGSNTNQPSGTATGDFSIDGLDIPGGLMRLDLLSPTADPPEFDVVFEDAGSLGVSAPPTFLTNQAEWFGNVGGLGNPTYSGNPLDPNGGPGGSAHPIAPVHSIAMTALENTSPTGTPVVPLTAVQSLSIVAGTIIYLNPFETDNQNLIADPQNPAINGGLIVGEENVNFVAGATSYSTVPTTLPRFREQVIRPLVSITPRRGRTASPNLTITVRMDTVGTASQFGFDLSTAVLLLNGALFPLTLPPGSPIRAAPATFQWTISIPSILTFTSAGPNTPINVSFTIRAVEILGQSAIDPGEPTQARVIVLGVGRNDVVL